MAGLGQLIIRIGADVRNFTRGLNDATNNLNRWSRQAEEGFGPIMDSIGQGLLVVGSAAAVGFGALIVGSVKGASSLEQYRNTLNIVMKDQQKAAEVMAWAVDFANRTPFETASVVEATVRLQSYGLEAQKVLPAIGDMAAVMNTDIMQAVEAVADAQMGELERLKEFGITKAMIIEHGNTIMRGVELVNQQGQIVDQENFNKTLFSLMDERFKGGMEIQANSLKGLWSTVTGVFKTSLATMAGISVTGEIVIGGLFDKIKNKIKGVIDTLNEWQKKGQLQEWVNQAQAAFTTFWNIAEKVFNGLVDAGKFIADKWDLIGPILAGVLAGFLAFTVITGILNAITVAQLALNLVMAANPIALIVLAIAGLVAAGVYLYQNWDKVKGRLLAIWEGIRGGAVAVSIKVQEAWLTMQRGIMNIVRRILDTVAPLIEWLPDRLIAGFGRMRAGVGEKLKEIQGRMDDLSDAARENFKKVQDSLGDVTKGFGKTADAAQDMTAIAEETEAVMHCIEDSAKSAGEKAAKAAEDTRAAWEQAADVLGTRLQILKTQHEIAAMAAEEQSNKIEQLALQSQQLSRQLEIQRQIVAAVNDGYLASIKAKGATAEETEKLRLKLVQEQKAQAELERQIYDTNESIQSQIQELRDLSTEVAEARDKYQRELVEALDDYQHKVADVNARLADDERKLTQEYETQLSQRADALANFVGLFDEVTTKDVSGEELLKNLQDQVSTFEDWQANITELSARGVDEGLIAELREMGPKAAPEIAALLTLTDDQLGEYQSLWKRKMEAARNEATEQLRQQKVEMQQKLQEIRAAATEQLEAYRLEWEKKNAEIRKNADKELTRIQTKFDETAQAGTVYGVALIQNFAQGMESQFDYLQQQVDRALEIADQLDPTMRHSPSLVDRVKSGLNDILSAYKNMAAKMQFSAPSLSPISSGFMSALIPSAGATAPILAGGGGNNTFNITIYGHNYEEIAAKLKRDLARAGVKGAL